MYDFAQIISFQDTFTARMSRKCPSAAPFPASAEYIDQKIGRTAAAATGSAARGAIPKRTAR
jgi:hypothetical protein